MTDKRVFREPLRQEWADALLNVSVEWKPEQLEPPASLGGMLGLAQSLLSAAVEHAREALVDHPLAQVVADAAAKEAGKRGRATLAIDADGIVMLEVHYGEKPVVTKRPPEEPEDSGRKWSTKLPTLAELRQEADELGIDITDLGRAKKRILARLAKAKGEPVPASPRKKRVKRAPALTPARVVVLPTPEPEPGDTEPPELEMAGDDDTPVSEQKIEAAVEAKSDKTVDMAALLTQAGEMDLDNLLAKLEQDSDD